MRFQDVVVVLCYVSRADTLCVMMEIIVVFFTIKDPGDIQ